MTPACSFGASWSVLGAVLFSGGCAQLHHVQVGEMDVRAGAERFEVVVNETGFDLEEATSAAAVGAGAAGSRSGAGAAGSASTIWELLTYGPKTGDLTFSDDYADGIANQVLSECPAESITGLYVVRESADYPVISGELVRVVGYCAPGASK